MDGLAGLDLGGQQKQDFAPFGGQQDSNPGFGFDNPPQAEAGDSDWASMDVFGGGSGAAPQ